jgi:dethiobiotin synthetase
VSNFSDSFPRRIFVTGIGTDVGKTLVSAIAVDALGADYWKPVQCGSLNDTDTETLKRLTNRPESVFHPEGWKFTAPMSPHAAAARERKEIIVERLKAPETSRPLVIEGAGGLLVPLNSSQFVIDHIAQLDASVILVSRHYLGSINHTLLSAEALRVRRIPVLGIVFNGGSNAETEEIILSSTGFPFLLRVNEETDWNRKTTARYAEFLKSSLASKRESP